MNDILNISSKNSYLTSRQWEKVVEYVKNRKNIVEESVVEELDVVEPSVEIVHSEAYEQMIQTTSVSDMYMVLLAIMNKSPEKLYEVSPDELQVLYDTAKQMNEKNPSEDYVDLADTLQYLAGEHDLNGAEILASYIYFDLYKGNVTITESEYSGKDKNGNVVSGVHNDSNQYYVYQSKESGNSYDSNGVPRYNNVTYNEQSWGDYITNHPKKSNKGDDSVDELIIAWDTANKNGRTVTSNTVTVKTIKSGTTFNITVDNLWASNPLTSENINTGLSFQSIGTTERADDRYGTHTDCATNVIVNLYVKGDNRFDRLHCATNDGQNGKYICDTNHTNIINITGDANATLTLANPEVDKSYANTSALIGGTDAKDHSFKMTFDKITVYAGGARLDFGTAIGGGGNGDGRVTINGGRITAVNSSTGTAIGGGCGTAGPGGYGNVTINGGEVYAYNYTPHFTSENSTSFTDAMPTAIGGGSSGTREGGIGIVNITGGYVYAYSEVGNAIGGGGGGNGKTTGTNGNPVYYSTYGGTADVTISGNAIVEAVSGTGCAIGGGQGGGRLYNGSIPSGMSSDGGTAKLTISGNPTIRSGSIGGGSPLDANRALGATVGAAVVNISGGNIHGQIVMDGIIKNATGISGLTNGTLSSFSMSGGVIDNTPISDVYHFVEENGGAVYIHSGSAMMSGGTIQNATSLLGGAIYVNGGSFAMDDGTIKKCKATNGGAVCVEGGNVTINGGAAENNTATNGGFAYINNGGFTMNNGHMYNNAAEVSGGAIYIVGGDASIDSGTVVNNIALNRGGAVYVANGNVIIGTEECHDANESSTHSHPVIENNIASDGGGLYVDGGTTTMWCGDIKHNKTFEKTVNVLVTNGNFTYNGGSIGVPYDTGVFVTGGVFDDNVSEAEGKIKHELHYHSVLGDETHNGKIPESKWIASPRGDVLNKDDCDYSSVTWGDLFPKYEFVGWESHEDNTDEIVNLYAIWEEK